MRKRLPLAAIALAAVPAACAIRPTANIDSFAERSGRASFEVMHRSVKPSETLLLPVVFDRQTEGPACGAHAIASLIKYWRKNDKIDGSTLFRAQPPKSPSGYSMAELLDIAKAHRVAAFAVHMDEPAVIAELEKGRPVLVPVRVPSIYVQQRTIPVDQTPVIGTARNFLMARSGWVSEKSGLAMVSHYLLVIGHGDGKFVVLDPVMGFRTISAKRLDRYRQPFADAAIVSSAS
jgi:hypothetical protein